MPNDCIFNTLPIRVFVSIITIKGRYINKYQQIRGAIW